jgi:hypothetical protein
VDCPGRYLIAKTGVSKSKKMNDSSLPTENDSLLEFTIRAFNKKDHIKITKQITVSWGAEYVVAHGKIFFPARLPGFIAEERGKMIGLLTYFISGNTCEIITLDSWREKHGVGTALVQAVRNIAIKELCRKLWLVTTNDNTHALHFYQKRGFSIAAIRVNEMERARTLKPQIPIIGQDGIPIRDEIELDMILVNNIEEIGSV